MAKIISNAPIHMIKLAVGVDDVGHLHALQSSRLFDFDGALATCAWTRRKPTRDAGLLNGGSIYWVIKGRIQARQAFLGFDMEETDEGPYCRLILDPALMLVAAMPHRAFQGWRYLDPVKAPPDLRFFDPDMAAEDDEMPADLAAQLRDAGLI